MSCPAGKPVRSTRAVKSVSARAAGPVIRRALRNASFVANSTRSRAGRSVLLHTMARSPVTSPLCTPYGNNTGRRKSDGTTAGACPCAHDRLATTKLPAAAAAPLSMLRRPMAFAERFGSFMLQASRDQVGDRRLPAHDGGPKRRCGAGGSWHRLSRSGRVGGAHVTKRLLVREWIGGEEVDRLAAIGVGGDGKQLVACRGGEAAPGLEHDGGGAGDVPEGRAVVVHDGERPQGDVAEMERRRAHAAHPVASHPALDPGGDTIPEGRPHREEGSRAERC